MLKYARNHKQGMVSASELAALTGQTELMIRTCLKWFDRHTEIAVTTFSEDMYQLDTNPVLGALPKARIPTASKFWLMKPAPIVVIGAACHYLPVLLDVTVAPRQRDGFRHLAIRDAFAVRFQNPDAVR